MSLGRLLGIWPNCKAPVLREAWHTNCNKAYAGNWICYER